MKKPLALAIAAIGSLAAPSAFADSFQDNARVLSARPVYERIPVSREECWNDRVRGYEERRVTRSDTGAPIGAGTVLGAVVGGVIGHQFANSSGGAGPRPPAGPTVGGVAGNQNQRDPAGRPPARAESQPDP